MRYKAPDKTNKASKDYMEGFLAATLSWYCMGSWKLFRRHNMLREIKYLKKG